MSDNDESTKASVELVHHGAAANSQRGVIAWIPQLPVKDSVERRISTLVYASHSVINLASVSRVALNQQQHTDSSDTSPASEEPVWNVKETLCTDTTSNSKDDGSGARHVITCLASLSETQQEHTSTIFTAALVSGFADGTVTCWIRNTEGSWSEMVVQQAGTRDNSYQDLAITCVDAVWVESEKTLLILIGTSAGATLFECYLDGGDSQYQLSVTRSVVVYAEMAVSSVRFRLDSSLQQILCLIGTAAPRHNKIHVLHASTSRSTKDGHFHFHYSGALSGHEDWITSMAWTHNTSENTTSPPLLATGSQDARVRLWKFTTTAAVDSKSLSQDEEEPELIPTQEDIELSDSDDDAMHEEEEEEGESRMDIQHNNYLTRVTLEALLVGHEEGITSVCWYRYSKAVYNQEHLLLSSSMDRSILLWTPGDSDGIWTPLTRVGSAGGILGGSVGSSLLGYLGVSLEPTMGLNMLGAAYGGSIHVWNLDGAQKYISAQSTEDEQQVENVPTNERVLSLYWKATPCVTGHFSGVADLCWEASSGQYLLTASDDQTCRLWCPAQSIAVEDGRSIWLEVARPQVHGYNIAAVTSLSCSRHPHYFVSGADEKELRGFDAPQMSLRMLEAVTGQRSLAQDGTERVERAYIPSLGLSNKATAAEGAEEDSPDETLSSGLTNMKLPLERDLGAVSLWPEVQKLFGHKTELYCVTSTLEAQSAYATTRDSPDAVLVASTCKARDAEAAAIRLWRAHEGKSHQVLSEGGHKSTVATLAFSPDRMLLASSGKDRRLCLWKCREDGQYSLAWSKDSAHKRIIWSAHFLPWGDQTFLATGSRDGTVKIWSIVDTEDGTEATVFSSFSPSFKVGGKPDAVTSVSFSPKPQKNGNALLALGLESGRLELWNVPTTSSTPFLNTALVRNLCHKATVTQLAWRPMTSADSSLTLASSSMDHGCRVFEIRN